MKNLLPLNRPVKHKAINSRTAASKVFVPLSKGRTKTSARGYWQDNGKVYYDYIRVLAKDKLTIKDVDKVKRDYNQLAVFFTVDGKGYIYHNKGKIDILHDRKLIVVQKTFKGLKNRIKALLARFGGLTLYIGNDRYLIEIYY